MYHFDLINSLPLKISPHGSFEVNQLCESVAICEAVKGDINNWGNATDTEPAFLVYLGCKKEEVSGYIKTFTTFYRCEWCEVRNPKYLKDCEAEMKIRGIQRYSDELAFGLDYLVESEQWKHIGCNSDEYDYYTTGTQQRW
jgi:hypothetical protein